jgi:hypothetical protein
MYMHVKCIRGSLVCLVKISPISPTSLLSVHEFSSPLAICQAFCALFNRVLHGLLTVGACTQASVFNQQSASQESHICHLNSRPLSLTFRAHVLIRAHCEQDLSRGVHSYALTLASLSRPDILVSVPGSVAPLLGPATRPRAEPRPVCSDRCATSTSSTSTEFNVLIGQHLSPG